MFIGGWFCKSGKSLTMDVAVSYIYYFLFDFFLMLLKCRWANQ